MEKTKSCIAGCARSFFLSNVALQDTIYTNAVRCGSKKSFRRLSGMKTRTERKNIWANVDNIGQATIDLCENHRRQHSSPRNDTRLHERKRLQASEELCAYRKFMVGCYQRGRIKIFLRNLLGEHKPKFDCDTIRCPLTDMFINHPEELAWVLSIHFQD